jgi:hypothetical protein
VRRLSISDNNVRDWYFTGVTLMGPNHFNHTIVGNTFNDNGIRGNSGQGLNLQSVDGVTVVGNRSRGNKLSGINVQDTITETLVTGNDTSNNLGASGAGISLSNTTGQTLVTGNGVVGNTGVAIARTNLNGTTFIFQNAGDDPPIARHLSGSATMVVQSVSKAALKAVTLSVPNASIGDTVAVGYMSNAQPPGPLPAGIVISGAVTANGTVTVTFFNGTVNTITVPAGTVRADVLR